MPSGEFWTLDSKRGLVAPGAVGRGTDKLTCYDNYYPAPPTWTPTYSHLELRAKLAGVTVPTNLTNDWSENPSSRVKPITQRAWNDFKTLTDNLRTNENAGAFNWTKTINASGGAVGPLGYRNEACAAFERWIVDQQTVSTNGYRKFGVDSDGYLQTIQDMYDFSPQATSNLVYSRILVPTAPAIFYQTEVHRVWITIVADSDDLPSSVSKYILAIPIRDKWDDLSRDWSLQLYKGTGTSYDNLTFLIQTWTKANIPAPTGANPEDWGWIYADVTSWITTSSGGTTNYFWLKINHDSTTAANGTWNYPSEPSSGTYREGIRTSHFQAFTGVGFGHEVFAFVNDLTDI